MRTDLQNAITKVTVGEPLLLKGKVMWFSDDKGYGFLASVNGGKDVYVHFTAIDMEGRKKLLQGQRVVYQLGQDKSHQPYASYVRVVTA